MTLTAVYIQVPKGFIGFVGELPVANTQGATLNEARANLQKALAMVIEANSEESASALCQDSIEPK